MSSCRMMLETPTTASPDSRVMIAVPAWGGTVRFYTCTISCRTVGTDTYDLEFDRLDRPPDVHGEIRWAARPREVTLRRG